MIKEYAERFVWLLMRVLVTFACLWTIQNTAKWQGYYIPFSSLMIMGICSIVGIRMWVGNK